MGDLYDSRSSFKREPMTNKYQEALDILLKAAKTNDDNKFYSFERFDQCAVTLTEALALAQSAQVPGEAREKALREMPTLNAPDHDEAYMGNPTHWFGTNYDAIRAALQSPPAFDAKAVDEWYRLIFDCIHLAAASDVAVNPRLGLGGTMGGFTVDYPKLTEIIAAMLADGLQTDAATGHIIAPGGFSMGLTHDKIAEMQDAAPQVDLEKIREELHAMANRFHGVPIDTEACNYYAGVVQEYESTASEIIESITPQKAG